MFQDEFIKDLRLILFVSRFWMIGHLFSQFTSLWIDDFYKTKQISNDFDSDALLFLGRRCFRMNLSRICD